MIYTSAVATAHRNTFTAHRKEAVVKIVPEKTIEIWTAFSLVGHLGLGTDIRSWPRGVDQTVVPENLRKWFMLELKAPMADRAPYFDIDLAQLNKYLDGYRWAIHPDVLYVLPGDLYKLPILRRLGPPADPNFQRCFCRNSYVIRATELAKLLNGPMTYTSAQSARIRSMPGSVKYRSPSNIRSSTTNVATLHDTLRSIGDCNEPPGMSFRSPSTLEQSQAQVGFPLLA